MVRLPGLRLESDILDLCQKINLRHIFRIDFEYSLANQIHIKVTCQVWWTLVRNWGNANGHTKKRKNRKESSIYVYSLKDKPGSARVLRPLESRFAQLDSRGVDFWNPWPTISPGIEKSFRHKSFSNASIHSKIGKRFLWTSDSFTMIVFTSCQSSMFEFWIVHKLCLSKCRQLGY